MGRKRRTSTTQRELRHVHGQTGSTHISTAVVSAAARSAESVMIAIQIA